MIKQLALCSVQNGAGSTGYLHSFMLRMYDDTNEEETPQYNFQEQNQEPPNSQITARQEPIPKWCKCGNCCTIREIKDQDGFSWIAPSTITIVSDDIRSYYECYRNAFLDAFQ